MSGRAGGGGHFGFVEVGNSEFNRRKRTELWMKVLPKSDPFS